MAWLGYVAIMTGVPPKIANNFARPRLAICRNSSRCLRGGARLALAWLYLALATAPSPHARPYALGPRAWRCLGHLRHAPAAWADHIRSYRGVALQSRQPFRPAPDASRAASSPRRSAPRSVPPPGYGPKRCKRRNPRARQNAAT